MAILLLSPLFFLLCISVAGQQLLQISSLHHQDSTINTLGVSVDHEKLNEVSSSVLMAENWLRTHVLSRYPSSNITSIVVSNRLLCEGNREEIAGLVLFAMQNVHHSLVRWGLERKIRVSVGFTTKCLYQSHLERVFEFLEEVNSTYTVKLHDLSDDSVGILSSYSKSMADLGDFRSKTSRKLLTEFDYSVPSDAAVAPLPPLIGVTMPPPAFSLPLAPDMQPPMTSAQPPYGFHLPPCNPYPNPQHGDGSGGAMAAPPVVEGGGAVAAPPVAREELWCVAKPSVPTANLQAAMDYACGEGGADCGPIGPAGSCYFPDSIVAHASYAFNSYWQKNKNNGGTCGFGGTAMLINSDPSFLQCHFTVA